MAKGPLIKKLLYSSWFLAALPATIIFLLLPPIGSQYKIEIKDGLKNDGAFIYSDLNTDSISELIVPVKSGPYFSLMIRNNDFLVYDQWNFKDSIAPSISEVFTGNFDHDKFSEIYVFTYKGDSLFLNVNEILQPSGTRMDRVFITRIGYAKGQVAATLRPAGFFDTDMDGHDDLYFIISSYFRLGTRRLFSFDLANKN
ncbi:MAG: hypothetical protein IPJ37_22665 [Bacteroidales bacterium]|nr:hypothetical protein [Bacteroidales bacterium]